MRFPSTRQKSKVINLVYRMTQAIYGNQVNIARDSLGKMYEINRFAVFLDAGHVTPKEMHKRLKASLIDKLNAEDGEYGILTYKDKSGAIVRISMEVGMRKNTLYIMVH